MKLKKLAVPVLAGLMACQATGASAAELQRSDVEKIVHDYLLSHPELLIDMSNALRAKQEADQQKADDTLLKQYHDALFNQKQDPVGGNLKGSKVIVEFFDYNCGYCKRSQPLIQELISSNKDVRYIYKEFPILSETSYISSKAALAVQAMHPEKYEAFHNALMNHQGALKDQAEIANIAKSVGLNWSAIEKKMSDPDIDKQISATRQLAQELGLSGTPAFIVGDNILRGAPRSMDDFKSLLSEAK